MRQLVPARAGAQLRTDEVAAVELRDRGGGDAGRLLPAGDDGAARAERRDERALEARAQLAFADVRC